MNKRGQIVVEYVLLLVIAIGISTFLVKQLISRDPNNTGIIVNKWHQILKAVGDDVPDRKP